MATVVERLKALGLDSGTASKECGTAVSGHGGSCREGADAPSRQPPSLTATGSKQSLTRGIALSSPFSSLPSAAHPRPAQRHRPARAAVGTNPYSARPLAGLYEVAVEEPVSMGDLATSTQSRVEDHPRPVESLLRHGAPTPVPCSHCKVHVETTERTSLFTATLTFDCSRCSERPLALLFPVSECGRVDSLRVTVNQRPLLGEIARSRRLNGNLVTARDEQRFRTPTSEDESEKAADANGSAVLGINRRSGEAERGANPSKHPARKRRDPPLYYFVCADVRAQTRLRGTHGSGSGSAVGTNADSQIPVTMVVQWRSRDMRVASDHSHKIYCVGFSYLCLPRLPDEVRLVATFSTPLRQVTSPNGAGFDVVSLHGGNVTVVADQKSGLFWDTDHAFALHCHVGDDGYEPMALQPVFVLALIAMLLVGIWHYYTSSLEL